MSHQAPHEPYHLPKEWRSRHVGEYDKGYDAFRQERQKCEVELGIMPAGTQLAERMWFVPDSTLLAPASRAILGKKIEIYAGLVENLDHHVGRLIDHLKKIGEYDNTIFIVFGDNGAEGGDLFELIAGFARFARLSLGGDALVEQQSQRVGQPGVLARLRTDVGAGSG